MKARIKNKYSRSKWLIDGCLSTLLHKKKNFILITSFLIFLTSCVTPVSLYNQDYANHYDHRENKLNPKFKVYHHSNTNSTLYFKFNSDNVLFAKPVDRNEMMSKLRIKYHLFSEENDRNLLDSASFQRQFTYKSDKPFDITDSIIVPSSFGNGYMMDVEISDINKHQVYSYFVKIDKRTHFSDQNFLVYTTSGEIWMTNYIQPETNYYVKYNDELKKSIGVKSFSKQFPLPIPPFSEEQPPRQRLMPDSAFIVYKENFFFKITSGKVHDTYLLEPDSTVKQGLSLQIFNSNYPQITDFMEMIGPLRYLTMRNEFEELVNNENPKGAIDKFWLDLSGGKDRARELIRVFYNRVQDTNEFFASHTEGWRTDRGLIFLIYGAPTHISKSSRAEIWTYGELNNYRSLNFTFYQLDNPLSSNDFQLERNPIFRDDWMRAVDVWRQGRVYNSQ